MNDLIHNAMNNSIQISVNGQVEAEWLMEL